MLYFLNFIVNFFKTDVLACKNMTMWSSYMSPPNSGIFTHQSHFVMPRILK